MFGFSIDSLNITSGYPAAVSDSTLSTSALIGSTTEPVMAKKQLLEDILRNPARFYRMPGDVLRDRHFGGVGDTHPGIDLVLDAVVIRRAQK